MISTPLARAQARPTVPSRAPSPESLPVAMPNLTLSVFMSGLIVSVSLYGGLLAVVLHLL